MRRLTIEEDELEELPLETQINNLSKLVQQRIEKRAIKLTKRGSSLSSKEATKVVKEGNSWAAIITEYNTLRKFTIEIMNSVLIFTRLDKDELVKTGLTVSELSRFKDDLTYFTNQLTSIDITNRSGKITADDIMQFNHIVITVNNLAQDMFRILTPIQGSLQIAAATYRNNTKESSVNAT